MPFQHATSDRTPLLRHPTLPASNIFFGFTLKHGLGSDLILKYQFTAFGEHWEKATPSIINHKVHRAIVFLFAESSL